MREVQTVLLLILAIVLAGCADAPRKPQSVEEGIYIAAVYAKALAVSVNDAYTGAAITKAQQLEALDVLQGAKNGLQVALDAFNAGRYGDAEDRLTAVESALRSVALIVARIGEAR